MTAEEFKSRLRQVTFWDVPIENLDVEKNKRQIIERVFTHGNLDELRVMRDFYSRKEIIEEMTSVRCLDHLTLNFCSELYQVPLEKFRCYTGGQLDRNYLGY